VYESSDSAGERTKALASKYWADEAGRAGGKLQILECSDGLGHHGLGHHRTPSNADALINLNTQPGCSE